MGGVVGGVWWVVTLSLSTAGVPPHFRSGANELKFHKVDLFNATDISISILKKATIKKQGEKFSFCV